MIQLAVNWLSKLLFIACLQLIAIKPACADTVVDPVVFLETITQKVLKALRSEKQSDIHDVIEKIILPNVDFEDMGRWVAGRNAWQGTSLKVKQSFVTEFSSLVVNTYIQALNAYTDEKLVFQPIRSSYLDKKRILVKSTIVRTGDPNIDLAFRLVRHDASWKLYDLVIQGVSILKGYQAQFSTKIRKGGLESVIEDLQSHNSRGK